MKTKIIYDIPKEEELPFESESLWVEDLGSNRYKLVNVPFFIPGVAIDDIVEAPVQSDGFPHYQRLHTDGGKYTTWVYLPKQPVNPHQQLREFLKTNDGYQSEGGFGVLYSICCSMELLFPLHEFLEDGFEQGLWEWEWGKQPTEEQWRAFNSAQKERIKSKK